MELVPIVQLTLGIFAGLLVLALTVSYISAKLKRRTHNDSLQGNHAKIINLNERINNGPVIVHDQTGQYAQQTAFKSAGFGNETSQNRNTGGFAPVKESRRTPSKFTVLNNINDNNPDAMNEAKSKPASNFPSRSSSSAIAMFK